MPATVGAVGGNSGPVEVGPGVLFAAVLGTAEPVDLPGHRPSDPAFSLDSAWAYVGYTDTGYSTQQNLTVSDVEVEEEYEPVDTRVTKRTTQMVFSAAEYTPKNLQRAFNGGTLTTLTGGNVTFEPPTIGQENKIMLLHVSESGLIMWLFRRCLQVGNIEQQMKKAPQKRLIPMTFRVVKPAGVAPWKAYLDSSLAAVA